MADTDTAYLKPMTDENIVTMLEMVADNLKRTGGICTSYPTDDLKAKRFAEDLVGAINRAGQW